ncbi:MAG: hypothetical protein ABI840_10325 [bacterium]
MKNLKIKKQDRVTRNKTIRARKAKIVDSEVADYLFYGRDFPIQFLIPPKLDFLRKSNYRDLKRN